MKRIALIVLLSATALTGCQTAQYTAAQDNDACRSYGARPGSDVYVNCRVAMASQRRQQQDAAADAMMVGGLAMMGGGGGFTAPAPSLSCTTKPGLISGYETTCN
jgi:Holliday junction resolvasome RuvABC endonuclease subunit